MYYKVCCTVQNQLTCDYVSVCYIVCDVCSNAGHDAKHPCTSCKSHAMQHAVKLIGATALGDADFALEALDLLLGLPQGCNAQATA